MNSWQAVCLFVAIFAMILIYGYVMYRKGFNDAVDQYQDHLNVVIQELDDAWKERYNDSNFYNHHNGGE